MDYPRARRSIIRSLALAGTLCLTASFALGDEVVLRDGTVHTGKVVSRDRRSITIDTQIHGISTRLTIDRRNIKSIILGDTNNDTASGSDANEADEANPTASTTPTLPTLKSHEEDERKVLKRDGYNLILEVPLEGTFGEHIYPLGVAESLAYAKEIGATDVVFRINSPGGQVWCALDMVEIIREYKGEFKMHMLIESAISASIWPTFNCDTITMAPGSDFGGAVVYSRNETGSAEVDKKMNSILSSKIESMADANGHSPYLVRAMILSEAAVYAYKDADGEWVLTDSLDDIPPHTPYETIDSPDTVLTLTAKQASKYGIVTAIEDNSLESFCKAHGIEKWDNAGNHGYEIVEETVEDCRRVRENLEAAITSFYRELGQYGNAKSFRSAGAALNSMKKYLGQYKRYLRKAEEMHMPSIVDSFDKAIDVTYWQNWLDDAKADLRRAYGP